MIRKFSDMLEKGKLYVISNFGVGQNVGSYRTTHHQFIIFTFIVILIYLFLDVIGEVIDFVPIENFERNGKE